jgi:hypothetical protein
MRERMIDTVIEDQTKSLDAWIDYLTSDDAMYPAWFKFFAFHQITKLSQFDKERQAFKKRTPTTTAPFPDIDREALAQVADLYARAHEQRVLTDAERAINIRKFPAAYAHFMEASLAAQQARDPLAALPARVPVHCRRINSARPSRERRLPRLLLK